MFGKPFCAAAACLDLALVEADEPLHVLPASYAVTEEALALPGTKVLMKMGRSLEETRETLRKQGLLSRAMLVQNCGLPGERICRDWENEPLDPSYFSMIVIKEERP